VATLLRARLGEMLERRRERIKQASSEQAQAQWDPKGVPPSRDPVDHRSGVKPSQPSLGHPRPERADQTSFGRVSTDQILSMRAIGSSSTSTVPNTPSALGEPVETPETGVVLPPRAVMSMESARASSTIQEAIKSSLVPSPLDVVPPSSASPRAVMEARALTAPARDVPIPILSPMTGPQMAGPMTGPPSMPRGLEGPGPVEEPPAGLGQYALAAFVGLLFAVAIGGAGLYFWKSRQTVVVLPPPTPITAPSASSSSAVMALAASTPASAKPEPDPPASASAAAPTPSVSAKKPKAKPKPTDPNAIPENPY
jgi:hypothetical protein